MMAHALTLTTPSDREIAMTRTFDAPRDMVFEAFTRPELIKRWLGVQNGWEMVVCEVDLRIGGTYRYVWRRTDGMEMGMGGTYREIVRPERIVTTESFDQSWYPGSAVGTVTLVERDGVTTLTLTVLYDSREARDLVLQSPMESGVEAGYRQLENVLASLRTEGDGAS
ncbi:MAG: SRPBCC family protein [Bacteroidetes bacterium]|nr:SRPBCC family protein [Bacteroidota bacterium]